MSGKKYVLSTGASLVFRDTTKRCEGCEFNELLMFVYKVHKLVKAIYSLLYNYNFLEEFI